MIQSSVEGATDKYSEQKVFRLHRRFLLLLCFFLKKIHDMNCVYLGVGQPQTSQTASAVGFGVDGAELLFDRAEISHERIEIHILPLVQRLCRHRDIRMWDKTTNRAREEICFKVRLPETVCVCVCLTIDVVDGESVGEVGHVSLLSEGSFLLRGLLRASIIQTLSDRRRREFMCATPLSCCVFAFRVQCDRSSFINIFFQQTTITFWCNLLQ